MGSTIYYFSATGNSLDITRKIAKSLGDCTIKSMATQPPDTPIGGQNESIGFVFLVFYIGLPRVVRKFIEELDILKETYCFAFINFSGNGAGTLGMLEDILKMKDVSLSYADGVKMPGNYLVNYQAPDSDKVQEQLKIAADKVSKAGEAIANGNLQPVKRKAVLLSKIANRVYLYKNIAKWDEKFFASNKCIGCGQCTKVCPVKNIKIENRHPVWQHHCERCLACIHWCPCEAIQYGKKTIGRRRYHNPNVKVEDIISGGMGTSV